MKRLLILLMVLVGAVMATAVQPTAVAVQPTVVALTQEILMHKYQMVECKANALIDMANKLNGYNVSVENQSDSIAALNQNLARLRTQAEQGNVSGFNIANREVYQNMRQLAPGLRNGKMQMQKGKGAGKASEFNRMYTDIRQQEAQCLADAAKSLAKKELQEWKEWQQQKRDRLRILQQRNITGISKEAIKKLEEILSKHENISARYGALLDNSTIEQLRAMRIQMIQEKNLVRARYEIEYMKTLLNAINKTASEKGYENSVQNISNLLESANQKISGGYDEENFKNAWEELKQASEQMRELVRQMRTA